MISKLTFGLFSKEDSKNFMRLMKYVSPFKWRIGFALLAIMGVAFTESYLAAFIAPLVNQGFAPLANPVLQDPESMVAILTNWKDQFMYLIWGTPDKVWVVPIFFMSLVILRGVCRFASSYLLSWVSVVAISHLRRDMFQKNAFIVIKIPPRQSIWYGVDEHRANGRKCHQQCQQCVHHTHARYDDCVGFGGRVAVFKLAVELGGFVDVSCVVHVVALLSQSFEKNHCQRTVEHRLAQQHGE